MPGVYGWDIGGSKAVAAKVEDGGVTMVPNKLTGDRFTPVVVSFCLSMCSLCF